MSIDQTKCYIRLFQLFCILLIFNIKLECAIAELYATQSKYIKNHLQYFSRNNGKYKSSFETEPRMDVSGISRKTGGVNDSDNFLNKLSWKCANNSSCLHNLLSSLLESYRHGDIIKLGTFQLTKLTQPYKSAKTVYNGRSMSPLMNFFNGYAVRIPIGPMVFSIQRSTDDADYIEVALLKKISDFQARFGGNDGRERDGETRIGEERKQTDKKEVQMFIPFYLAATTFGWTVLAFKAVTLMVLKALTLSKIAFVVAALVLLKKLMDSTSEKLMHRYNEPEPYMMPYSLDYGMHSAMSATPIEMAASTSMGGDMYAGSMPYHTATAGNTSPLVSGSSALTYPGLEHLTAESQILQTGTPILQNNTQFLSPSYSTGLGQMIKRTGSNAFLRMKNPIVRRARPMIYNYFNPYKQ